MRRLTAGTWITVLFAWLTVLSGTYLILPRYLAGLKTTLLAQPVLAPLNDVGMEWKMHIAWIAPVLATAVASFVLHCGPRLVTFTQLKPLKRHMYGRAPISICSV